MKHARQKAEVRRQKEVARSAVSSFILHPSSLALCLALLASGTASAQVLNDPTRPPSGFAVGDAEGGDAGGGIMLQSVMISPTRKSAIINGVMVKLGEKYGDAVLIRVAENEVVLKSGATQQVLKLYPGVEKREIAPAGETGASRREKSRSDAAPAASGGAQPR